ncbi:MAG: hypothetical protein JOZ17_21890 [Acetobacteraceae bacterium]|nr:hypothetical protein [Acetobacteraceae bacterium]MBV8615159.1 hypothetical protein [Acetobacteraceae bacterium]
MDEITVRAPVAFKIIASDAFWFRIAFPSIDHARAVGEIAGTKNPGETDAA